MKISFRTNNHGASIVGWKLMVCVVEESNIELPFTNSSIVDLNEVLRNISVIPDYLQRLSTTLRYDRGLRKIRASR